MNTHNTIPHTGEKNFQNANLREDSSIREVADPANEPIQQEEANPAIQNHLAEAPGGMVEWVGDIWLPVAQDPKESTDHRLFAVEMIKEDTPCDAICLSIAQNPKEATDNRLKAAELIQDATQRDTAYISIAQDPEGSIYNRLLATRLIQDASQKNAAHFSIAQDPEGSTYSPLLATELIQDATQRDAIYLSMAQDSQAATNNRLLFAKLIQGDTQRDIARLSIAQDPKVNINDRLKAAKLVKDATQKNTAYFSIAQDLQVDTNKRLKAMKRIQESTSYIQGDSICFSTDEGVIIQRDSICLSIAQNPKEDIYNRLQAAELIKAGTQRNVAYFSITQDPKEKELTDSHLAIQSFIQRDIICLSMAQDPKVSIYSRLKIAKRIQGTTQRDALYLSMAQDSKEATYDRMEPAKRIQDATQRDTAYLSIAQSSQEENPTDYRLWAAELIQDATQRDAAYIYIAQNSKKNEFTDSRMSAVWYIQDVTQRDAVYVSIVQDSLAQNPTFYMDNDLLAYIESLLYPVTLVIDQKTQEEAYQLILENILRIDNFKYVNEFITFSEKILNTQTRNLFIKTICQNWRPRVGKKLFQTNLKIFRWLYIPSDNALRAELITAIVIRTDLDVVFRKAVVEEHVQDPEERECLVKVIEEQQEASLNGSRTKKAQ